MSKLRWHFPSLLNPCQEFRQCFPNRCQSVYFLCSSRCRPLCPQLSPIVLWIASIPFLSHLLAAARLAQAALAAQHLTHASPQSESRIGSHESSESESTHFRAPPRCGCLPPDSVGNLYLVVFSRAGRWNDSPLECQPKFSRCGCHSPCNPAGSGRARSRARSSRIRDETPDGSGTN